ncbi:RNA-binding protein [Bartonella ancashensis]|uniref:Putative nucleic-acid-binding protein implicated in transcription termination n=1 Tax=Bartonella ancashensis TaxID=1318743 RepID=A0A0M4L6Q2_9HYPH|nr:RNA-binding protein [Bartonella ancashensis]ALE03396.1 putative nucleic-acid-binding protein implicated in transcription termination [Bartonella ancashensis]
MNNRTCIVTRKSTSAAALIRFVVDPDNQIVPDLKANLPGRGVWISGQHTIVEEAIKRKIFDKSFKMNVKVPSNLSNIVDELLLKSALHSLSMARKAGAIVTGITKVNTAIRSGQAILILHAKEAKEDGKRKISQAIYALQQQTNQNIKAISLFTNDEMGMAFGANLVIHAALLNVRAAEGFIKTIYKLIAYRDEERNEPDKTTAEAVKEVQ